MLCTTDFENWKGMTASTCALFTNIDTAYVPIGRLVTSGGMRLPALLRRTGAGVWRIAARYAGVRCTDLQ